MSDVLITASGLATPSDEISNEELVSSFNAYVDAFNHKNKKKIDSGKIEPLAYSDAAFIKKASGISSRFVIDKKNILDTNIMHPMIAKRDDSELSFQAEFGLKAAKDALTRRNIQSKKIDAVICACSNFQRPYPAIAIEIQQELGINGFAFDMNVACSSATFAIANAKALIDSDQAERVLIVNPEICSAHLNFKDRDSHFIFGDVATALIVEKMRERTGGSGFRINSLALKTMFSNNIRNNSGFLDRIISEQSDESSRLFSQNGRKVFKEVSLEVIKLLNDQLASQCISSGDLKRLWLHQANANMNRLIASKFLGYEPDNVKAPMILSRYANTASAGSIIAFHKTHDDFEEGDLGLLCSFGAGYSIGSIILEKVGSRLA